MCTLSNIFLYRELKAFDAVITKLVMSIFFPHDKKKKKTNKAFI